jgi:hypothetical protein
MCSIRRTNFGRPKYHDTDRACNDGAVMVEVGYVSAGTLPSCRRSSGSISRTPTQEVGQDATELAASRGQRVLNARRHFGIDRPLDQARLFQIAEPGRNGGRAHIAEPATEFSESDRAPVSDQAEQTERVPAADELRQRRRRAQTICVGERRAAAARGLRHTAF